MLSTQITITLPPRYDQTGHWAMKPVAYALRDPSLVSNNLIGRKAHKKQSSDKETATVKKPYTLSKGL